MPKKMHAVPMGTPCLYPDWLGNPALLQVFPLFHLYIVLSSNFVWTLVPAWNYPARVLCLVLAGALQNPQCKSKFWASTEGVICRNLPTRAAGCLLISSLPLQKVFTEGMKYTLELAGRSCERVEHMVILSCIPASQLDSHVGEPYAFAS